MINKSIKHLRLYCKELEKVENYEQAVNDKEHRWELHHRLELTLNNEYAHSREELKRLGMYYDRPYFELIFLKESDHKYLHLSTRINREAINTKISNTLKGHEVTKETRDKISKSCTGIRYFKSEFGKYFFDKYGITRTDNPKLYCKEYYIFHSKH